MNLGADIANMDSMSCSTFRQQRLTAKGDCWEANGSDDDMCLIDDEIDSIGKSPDDIHKVNCSTFVSYLLTKSRMAYMLQMINDIVLAELQPHK